jgi:ribose transport system ATP-binding protein
MSATPALLEARGLCKSFFGVQVLHDVGFALHAGKVLGLVGENGSGKSTTMNILGGVHMRDAGRIALEGADYSPRDPRDADAQGIAFIHQELNLFRNLTVAENLFITDFPRGIRRLPFIGRRAMRAQARALLAAVDLDIPPDTPVSRLSQGERQLVEIAKAIRSAAKVVIFDEPTTSLTTRETARLFAIIDRLRAQGIGVIYISHILSDVMALCDDIVVLRDGHVVASAPRAQMTVEGIIARMVGRTMDQIFPPRTAAPTGEVVLEARGIGQRGTVRDISFALHRGEVLGISGLMGAGRSELARILFGLDPFETGEIRVEGKVLPNPSPALCMERGMAFLTEDRRGEGLMMEAPILANMALPSLPAYARAWPHWVEARRLGSDVRATADSVRVAAADLERTAAKNLSGGNQQKVVIGKWLLRRPRVFILDEPTRGIDVGAKYEVYRIIDQLAAEGAGVLFISSEIEELVGLCDRIAVMAHGEIAGVLARPDFDREDILRLAMGRGLTAVEA